MWRSSRSAWSRSLAFQLKNFAGSGAAFVALAFDPGNFLLTAIGDGRNLGLKADPLFNFDLANPIQYSFIATLDASGSGRTVALPALPRGFKFYCAAVSFPTAGRTEITDVQEIEVR